MLHEIFGTCIHYKIIHCLSKNQTSITHLLPFFWQAYLELL